MKTTAWKAFIVSFKTPNGAGQAYTVIDDDARTHLEAAENFVKARGGNSYPTFRTQATYIGGPRGIHEGDFVTWHAPYPTPPKQQIYVVGHSKF